MRRDDIRTRAATKAYGLGFGLVVFLLMGQACLAQTRYQVDSRSSAVGFSIRNFLSQTPGVFHEFDGTLDFSAASPESSKVTFSVDIASIDTKIDKRDAHLRTDNYFGAATYPKMTFTSKTFQRAGIDRYLISGPITIKGHSKEISVVAHLARSAKLWTTGQDSLLFETSFVVDRLEFGVGEPNALLGNDVSVELKLDFRSKP